MEQAEAKEPTTINSIGEKHANVVEKISRDVRQFHEQKKPFRIFHGGTNSTRQPSYKRDSIIDTSRLTDILEISEGSALAEPNVSMGKLLAATLDRGQIPLIVPELPGITVGGAFAGIAAESSCFKYSLFDSTVPFIEVVLADGTIVTASKDHNADLLRGAAGTCGTLGVITLLKVDLMPAKKYVELEYFPVKSADEALVTLEKTCKDAENQYVDGILFRQDLGVIMAGRLLDDVTKGIPIQRYTRARDDWFYCDAHRRCLRNAAPFRVAIPIVDYLFRWDRGAFWGGARAFEYFFTPFNRITRFLLDPFMHTQTIWHALHESRLCDRSIIQDCGVSSERAQEFIKFVQDLLAVYPLWLCPIRRGVIDRSSYQLHRPESLTEMIINVGMYDLGPTDPVAFKEVNRELERKAHELGGYKCLYARSYYTEKEFWDIYGEQEYLALRRKYNAITLPTLYDKVKAPEPCPENVKPGFKQRMKSMIWSTRPLAGLYGVLCMIARSDYLFTR